MTTIFAMVLVMAVIISLSLFVILVSDRNKQQKPGDKRYMKNNGGTADVKRNKHAGRYRGSMNPAT